MKERLKQGQRPSPAPFNLAEGALAGTNLIEAGAGTGKTYTIAGLYCRLLCEKGLAVRDILVVTYTVAATEELKDRIRRRIREALHAFRSGNGEAPGGRGAASRPGGDPAGIG
ncbi:MAG: UvrD-helicase domain-containing protein, partial [Proteobacteria bacterium]|nr:UvrD-helicase domain-containing protein [Pseudomonadota bacterium]